MRVPVLFTGDLALGDLFDQLGRTDRAARRPGARARRPAAASDARSASSLSANSAPPSVVFCSHSRYSSRCQPVQVGSSGPSKSSTRASTGAVDVGDQARDRLDALPRHARRRVRRLRRFDVTGAHRVGERRGRRDELVDLLRRRTAWYCVDRGVDQLVVGRRRDSDSTGRPRRARRQSAALAEPLGRLADPTPDAEPDADSDGQSPSTLRTLPPSSSPHAARTSTHASRERLPSIASSLPSPSMPAGHGRIGYGAPRVAAATHREHGRDDRDEPRAVQDPVRGSCGRGSRAAAARQPRTSGFDVDSNVTMSRRSTDARLDDQPQEDERTERRRAPRRRAARYRLDAAHHATASTDARQHDDDLAARPPPAVHRQRDERRVQPADDERHDEHRPALRPAHDEVRERRNREQVRPGSTRRGRSRGRRAARRDGSRGPA